MKSIWILVLHKMFGERFCCCETVALVSACEDLHYSCGAIRDKEQFNSHGKDCGTGIVHAMYDRESKQGLERRFWAYNVLWRIAESQSHMIGRYCNLFYRVVRFKFVDLHIYGELLSRRANQNVGTWYYALVKEQVTLTRKEIRKNVGRKHNYICGRPGLSNLVVRLLMSRKVKTEGERRKMVFWSRP